MFPADRPDNLLKVGCGATEVPPPGWQGPGSAPWIEAGSAPRMEAGSRLRPLDGGRLRPLDGGRLRAPPPGWRRGLMWPSCRARAYLVPRLSSRRDGTLHAAGRDAPRGGEPLDRDNVNIQDVLNLDSEGLI